MGGELWPGARLPDPVRRVAVLQSNGLGDAVLVAPALGALRAAFPAAELVVVGKPHTGTLLVRAGLADRVELLPADGVLIEENPYDFTTPAVVEFLRRLRAASFDLGVQLHGAGRVSNAFIARIEPRLTAGHWTPGAPRPMVYRQLACDESRATVHLALVARLGATTEHPVPVLSATSAELAASRRHVPAGCSPFVVLHPGASDPTRRWPAKRFAALGRHLADRLVVMVTGSAAERELVHAVAAGVPGAQVCTELTLPALIGVLSRARLAVVNDTGPMHLAAALGTPTVGIYRAAAVGGFGPLAEHHQACVADTPAAVSYPAVRTVVERLLHDPAPVPGERNKVGGGRL